MGFAPQNLKEHHHVSEILLENIGFTGAVIVLPAGNVSKYALTESTS
jgi:hypothetical protein